MFDQSVLVSLYKVAQYVTRIVGTNLKLLALSVKKII